MIHMHKTLDDDIFARCLVIMKNVVISYIKEYRGPTLRPPYDVIIMKILFFGIIWDDDFISEVKLKLCLIFQYFQNGRYFELATNVFTGSYTGRWIYQKDSHEHFRHFEFCSTLWLKYWRRYINFKIWPTLWPCDVIDDVTSAWNITCTTWHPQQCTCKILFVWHQSFIVKLSGQTSW